MLKIKIHNIDNHRVETTFRTYLYQEVQRLFYDIGISFVLDGNDWDMIWIAHPTYVNRYVDYEESVQSGIDKIRNFCKKGDVILFDGSDSPSLMGSWDVFKETDAQVLMKNSLYSDLDLYKKKSPGGRVYWEILDHNSFYNYSVKDAIENVRLSGCNWLSTMPSVKWFDYNQIYKPYDVCALFSYPSKNNWEWTHSHNSYYDNFRKKFLEKLEPLKSKFNILTLKNGHHLPIKEYYQKMQQSKIVFAPFGYGEIAPRDVEANMFGSILMKPDMNHINTLPNPYNQTTYVSIDWDGNNIQNEIERVVGDFETSQAYYIDNFRKEFVQKYDPVKFVEYTYKWISNLKGYGTE